MIRTVGRWGVWVAMTAGVVLIGMAVTRQFEITRRITGQLPQEKSLGAWLKSKLTGKAA